MLTFASMPSIDAACTCTSLIGLPLRGSCSTSNDRIYNTYLSHTSSDKAMSVTHLVLFLVILSRGHPMSPTAIVIHKRTYFTPSHLVRVPLTASPAVHSTNSAHPPSFLSLPKHKTSNQKHKLFRRQLKRSAVPIQGTAQLILCRSPCQ